MRHPMTGVLIAILLIGGFALIGCEDADHPAGILPFGKEAAVVTSLPAECDPALELVNNYLVSYAGRVFQNDATTFTYTVSGTGVDPALSHFTIELPDCAPELQSYFPTESVSINFDPQTGIYGIEWHLSVEPDDSVGRTYSITFPGDVSEGVVRTAVRTGDVTGTGLIPGPCAGFEIAGTVFVDADEDGFKDPDEESGIAGVTVQLVDSGGETICTQTDPLGHYSFSRPAGAYTLVLSSETTATDFNEELFASFDSTSPTQIDVTVGPDSFANDFGFSPQSEEIIYEFESGVLLTDGASVKYWKKQVRMAYNGGGGNADYDPATILDFIHQIEALFLESPYQFTDGNEVQEALAILAGNPRDVPGQLYQELLATEFNEVSGKGILDPPGLQTVLISWGESLLADYQAAGKSADTNPPAAGSGDKSEDFLSDALTIFGYINSGGGGGVDE